MSIATRKNITVPADGIYEPVAVAGRVVYVESSPVDTPAGVPTFHLERGGDGLPLYSRSALAWLPSFRRFWIRGTADAAGGSLRLLVYDDPCAEGIYGENPPLHFNPCPEPQEFPEPTGTPTHLIVSAGSDIRIYDSAGALTRNLVTGRTAVGQIYVDYGAEKVYWCEANATPELVLNSISFDGTGEVTVANFGAVSSATRYNVVRDASRGKFLISANSRLFECNVDGTGIRTISTGGIAWRGLAAAEDGVHLFACGSGSLVKYVASSGVEVDHDNEGSGNIVADVLTQRVFRHFGNNDRIGSHGYNPSTTPGNTIDSSFIETDISTSEQGLYIFERWLYYSKTNSTVNRVHIDDDDVEEEPIASGLPSLSALAPWWE